MGLQLEISRGKNQSTTMFTKVVILSCLSVVSLAAPSAEADPQFISALPHAAPLAYHSVPAANCETSHEILVTQVCTPSAENVCSKETVDTEEIEYEKVCKEVVDTICDAPVAHAVYKREAEAEAEADPHFFAHHAAPLVAAAPVVAPAPVALPSAHAVAHSVTATVKHACREVTTEHCVDNPKVKLVPVEVEHCHTVTKVSCSDVENKIPVTTCEPVETTHVAHAALPVAVPHVAPVAVPHVAPIHY